MSSREHDRAAWIRGFMRSSWGPFCIIAVDDLMLIPDFAFTCAMVGLTVVACMISPKAKDAVRMLRDAGIPYSQARDPILVRRVDTYGADGLMHESVSTTREWLREA